jgi:hypothetical protein
VVGLRSFKMEVQSVERCKNPWNGECKNNDIELYIYFQGERLPICRQCWTKMADRDVEW